MRYGIAVAMVGS